MTHKRRNILIRFLVSMLALLAIAVPVAQAEPGGLFDGTKQSSDAAAELRKHEVSDLGFLVGVDPTAEALKGYSDALERIYTATPTPTPDAVDRYVGNVAIPNVVPGYPAILPEVPAPTFTIDQLPAVPGHGPVSGPSTDLAPFSTDGPGVGVGPAIAPETGLQPFSTDGPRVGIAPDATPVTPVVVEPTAGGFDWRDAAIGFSVAAVLALLAAGAVMILRNRDRVATGMS